MDRGNTGVLTVMLVWNAPESSNNTESPWKNRSGVEVKRLDQLSELKSQALLLAEVQITEPFVPLTVRLIWFAVDSLKSSV